MLDASDVQSDYFLFDIPSQEKNIKFPQFCFMPSVWEKSQPESYGRNSKCAIAMAISVKGEQIHMRFILPFL
jgi:hypothetical protein